MRHSKNTKVFDRKKAARVAMMRSLAISLIDKKRITTTEAKAKYLRTYIEPLVTKARVGDLAARRQLMKVLNNENAVKQIIELAPEYKDRPGGYTRITRLGERTGDGAVVALIEFI